MDSPLMGVGAVLEILFGRGRLAPLPLLTLNRWLDGAPFPVCSLNEKFPMLEYRTDCPRGDSSSIENLLSRCWSVRSKPFKNLDVPRVSIGHCSISDWFCRLSQLIFPALVDK